MTAPIIPAPYRPDKALRVLWNAERTDFIEAVKSSGRTSVLHYYGPPGASKTWFIANLQKYCADVPNPSIRTVSARCGSRHLLQDLGTAIGVTGSTPYDSATLVQGLCELARGHKVVVLLDSAEKLQPDEIAALETDVMEPTLSTSHDVIFVVTGHKDAPKWSNTKIRSEIKYVCLTEEGLDLLRVTDVTPKNGLVSPEDIHALSGGYPLAVQALLESAGDGTEPDLARVYDRVNRYLLKGISLPFHRVIPSLMALRRFTPSNLLGWNIIWPGSPRKLTLYDWEKLVTALNQCDMVNGETASSGTPPQSWYRPWASLRPFFREQLSAQGLLEEYYRCVRDVYLRNPTPENLIEAAYYHYFRHNPGPPQGEFAEWLANHTRKLTAVDRDSFKDHFQADPDLSPIELSDEDWGSILSGK